MLIVLVRPELRVGRRQAGPLIVQPRQQVSEQPLVKARPAAKLGPAAISVVGPQPVDAKGAAPRRGQGKLLRHRPRKWAQ